MHSQVTRIPIQLGREESITQAAFVDKAFSDEILLISNQGNLYRKSLDNGACKLVLNLDEWIGVDKVISIYSYQHYIAIVNQRGRKGIILNLTDNSITLQLLRGEYQVEHCSFPIGFYSREHKVGFPPK